MENIVGIEFLPRGEGIVTRRPLEIQLVPYDGKPYAKFTHISTRFTDFSDVRKEIEKLNDEVKKKNNGVLDQPITLRIYKPHVLDLTLIDLPGDYFNLFIYCSLQF